MKVKDYEVPEDRLYTKEHEWAKTEGSAIVVGITDYAAKTLNDIVYVSLPNPGDNLTQFGTFGTVESIKAVSELYSPCSGVVDSVNTELTTHPELTNQSPYGDGWLLKVQAKDFATEKKKLLNPDEYAKHLESV